MVAGSSTEQVKSYLLFFFLVIKTETALIGCDVGILRLCS